MDGLSGKLIAHTFSPEGKAAILVLIEPNGDEHTITCLVKESGTSITGDGEMIDYLHHRFGTQAVSGTARAVVLGEQS